PVGGPGVALPALDDRPVLVLQGIRGAATLHGRFRLREARVEVRHGREDRRRGAFQGGPVTRELTVLEDDRLTRLVEQRRELEVSGELAVHCASRLGTG